MSKWIPISEFLEDDSASRLFVKYRVNNKRLDISKDLTGWDSTQTLKTERDLNFHPIKDRKGNIYLLADRPTKYGLGLSGKSGFDHGAELFSIFAEMYSNHEIMGIGMPLTMELFDQIPENMKYLSDTYWLATRCKTTSNRGLIYYGYVFVGYVSKHKNDLYADKHVFYAKNGIRPLIALPSNILINVGDNMFDGETPDTALRIKYGKC